MPVWHAKTRELREAGKLTVIGITQEQHPERCQLFAQWHGIDWPILWDPFNLTGSRVVPHFRLVDEQGIVWALRAKPDELAGFMKDAPVVKTRLAAGKPTIVQSHGLSAEQAQAAGWTAIEALLRRDARASDAATDTLAAIADRSAAHRFRAGVAYRMRYDRTSTPADFRASVAAWSQALEAKPNQYIWRRRIQQYGPRLDKPYPFYGWIATAQQEISARGETPIELPVALSHTESWGKEAPAPSGAGEPDPKGKIPTAPEPLTVEVIHVPDTGRGGEAVCAHVILRPNDRFTSALEIDPEAGAPVLWWGGKRVEGTASADPKVGLRFELELDSKTALGTGYALFYACTTSDGVCRYLRQELTPVRADR